MNAISIIPVTEAMKADYELMRSLVAVKALDWIVVRTLPARDARALASLESAGLIAYQPLEPVVRKHKRQRKALVDASRPIFPRYIFVGLDRSAGKGAELVSECEGVDKILSFHRDHRPHIVPAKEMQQLMEAAWTAQTDREFVMPQYLEIGENVRMTTFAWAGFTAEVTAYDAAKQKIEAEVNIFGRMTPVTVDVDKVERV